MLSLRRSARWQKREALCQVVGLRGPEDRETDPSPSAVQIDVEGFEPEVLRGASGLLLKGAVHNVMMEYSPGVAERHMNYDLYDQNPIVLAGLLKAGYRIVQMDDRLARGVKDKGWEGAMPPLEEVTLEALRHDMADAKRLRDRRLGCPLPGEVRLEAAAGRRG